MKKMNLKFFGLGAKIVLPLFLLVGLFLISSASVSAQYMPKDEAIGVLKQHVDQIGNPAVSLISTKDILTPEQAARDLDYYRKAFGDHLIHYINTLDKSVASAITEATDLAESKGLDEEALDNIKQEYVDLLTN